MYHNHFGLREEPFGVTPDRRFFYQTTQHGEAAATLFYAIQQRRGFALLLAHAGLGKTSVLFTLVQMLKGKAQIAYLPNPYYDRDTVLESIMVSLGLEPADSPAATHKLFYQYLLKAHIAGKTVVAVFDEAQDLNRGTLEAIRMLSNFETPDGKLLQIVLAGQPQLAATLRRDDCEQIRQRFSAIARLEPLAGDEIRKYMAHRLQVAGGSIGLFTPEAIDMIASASGGVPRNINMIGFNSLTLAYALEKERVGSEEVAEVLRDLALPLSEPQPQLAQAVLERSPAFAQTAEPSRLVWIAAGVALLAAGTFLLGRF
ncbi:MAG: AAA family ATPase [Bryobacteraceae bacterium]|jgi:type II secretory pathway predicted ATPase ExeA